MLFIALFALATATAAVAVPVDQVANQATASAHIFNKCSFDVNYWVNNQGPQVLPAGGSWGEAFVPNKQRDIVLMTSPRLYSDDPKISMSYTWVPDKATVWYDLYAGNKATSPFQGFKIVQKSAEPTCQVNQSPNGLMGPESHVTACRSDRDVDLWLCAQ
jgi:hypothetical protein